MSSDSGTMLREFLIGLGFKIDEAGLKKFSDEVLGVTTLATELGAAVVAAGVAAVAFVGKMADAATDLYWSGQRLRSGVADIKGFGYAVQQMGGDTTEALSSLEGLAAFLRNYPGGENYIRMMLGVETRDAKTGAQRAVTDIMADVGARLRTMPFFRQKVIANFLGIDDMTLMAMDRGLGKLTDRYKQLFKLSGVDPDKAAEGLKNFHNQLERIESTLYVLATMVAMDLLPVVGWLGDRLDDVLQWLLKIDKEIKENWEKSGWAKSVHDFAHAVGDLRTSLKDLGIQIGIVTTGTTDWLRPVKELLDVMKLLVDYTTQLTLLLSGKWKQSWAIGKTVAADWRQIAADVHEDLYGEQERAARRAGHPAVPKNIPPSADAAMRFFMSRGWTRAQAAGIVGNLKYEGNLDPRMIGDSGLAFGMGQWHADRQREFAKVFGHDIHKSSFTEQLAFVDYELRHKQKKAGDALLWLSRTAETAARIVNHLYERPRDPNASDAARVSIANALFAHLGGSPATLASTGNVTLNQRTEIRIDGAGEPHTVARHVAELQDRTNGNLLRNFKGAFA